MLTYLLHLGGPKIVEINNASTNPLNYVTLVTLVDARFATINTRISDYQFRSCIQSDEETLADYSNRLRGLARLAGVPRHFLE